MNIINNFDIFIFDLDDTIVKTEQYHYNAWLHTLKYFIDKHFYIDYIFFCKKFHSIVENNIKIYLENELELKNYDEIIEYKNNYYLNLINENKNKIKLVDGFDKFINKIIENNKEFIIVSNSPKEQIDFFSHLFPILQKSSKNYYREIIKKRKPNAECYKMVFCDFPNKKMIGFEDSITGIHSITQVPEISTYFINKPSYIHYDFIITNYKINCITNYLELI
jgi:beta-phosphoglucomutase-like phosphatase (HAD superfamily)